MKKLVLHLGLQKTGSTSLQETLLYNPAPLAAAGYAYGDITWPGEVNSNHSFPLIVAFSDDWHTEPEVLRRGWQTEDLKRHFTAAIERALDTDKNLILSGEDISDIPAEGLRAFADLAAARGFGVQPMMFVRSPLAFVTSMSQTRIRHGMGFHVFAARKSIRIATCLSVWPDLRTIAFTDAVAHKDGPFGAFLQAAGLPPASEFGLIRQNDGMSDHATRLIGHVNGRIPLFVDGAVNPLRAYLDTEPLAGITGPKFQLTRREFADYRAPIQTENATFATLLGPSFCDPNFSFPDAPPPWTTPELQQVLTAMRPLTGPLQDAIRDYFGTSPDVGAAQRAIACKILT